MDGIIKMISAAKNYGSKLLSAITMNNIFYWMIAVAFFTGSGVTILDQLPGWCERLGGSIPALKPATEGLANGVQQLNALLSVPQLLIQLRKDLPEEMKQAAAIEIVSYRLFDGVKIAVMTVVLPLIGAMAFFLGVMKLADKSGLMLIVAKLLRPVMVWLFPEVPANHPAMSAMIMNIAANALGLGNAATPFGLRAMAELDKLNPEKGTATNAMALFLAINTSSVTLLATGVMNQRAILGSSDPAGIIGTTLFATMCSTLGAVSLCKFIERFSRAPQGVVENLEQEELEQGYPVWVSVVAIFSLIPFAIAAVIFGKSLGQWIVPLMIFGFASWAWWKSVPVYETFIEGAKEGFETGVRIVPYLVAILGVVGMLRGAGTIEVFGWLVGPVTEPFGLPAEAFPMVLLRPLSGSGANGVMMSIMQEHGPDSYIGYLVSTIQGSSETTFYVLAVYFGSVGIQRIRHALIPGLFADLAGAIGAIIAVQMYFTYNNLW